MYRPRREDNIKRYLESCEAVVCNLRADDGLNMKYILGLSGYSNCIMGLYKP